ncbi:hypothetical protein N4Q66_26835, partial [Leclercia adecarboxylata]|uniref:hypothetical protein n=1 Tax=Leclercia adecarboxylata TaxID=83655 RepID=UPI00234E32E4
HCPKFECVAVSQPINSLGERESVGARSAILESPPLAEQRDVSSNARVHVVCSCRVRVDKHASARMPSPFGYGVKKEVFRQLADGVLSYTARPIQYESNQSFRCQRMIASRKDCPLRHTFY